MKFLSLEQIQKVAPSVFTKTPAANLSKHYTHIPTTRVISDMELLGWKVVKAEQVKARKNQGSQKHMLVFQNPDMVINGKDGDTVRPQVVMTNSHDGKASFQFHAGLFRLVCSNGLVIMDENMGSLKIRHMGYDFEALQDGIKKIVEQMPLTVEAMNKMKQTEVSQEQAIEFAKKALSTRVDEKKLSTMTIEDFEELITPTRDEDKGLDAWKLFNTVQEKVTSGMFEYRTARGRNRKARTIKNFQQDIKVNKDLYELALELV